MKPITDKEVIGLIHSDKVMSEFIVGKCLQCGNCCKYHQCQYYIDGCVIYKNRPIECRIYPPDRDEIREVKCKGFKSLRG